MPIDVPVQMPCRGFVFAAYETVHIVTTLSHNVALFLFIKKNQNAPRPSEHPLVRGEKISKR